ncbi:MAG: dTDP-glucose 4,6-dehydratase [Proteobacteria bacterium]|nr:dTDP-glucose 4,6-dehydratase [Pseudomonadota bacterium]
MSSIDGKKVILVTGGAGFIGGNFILGLLEQGGVKIINLDSLTYAGNLDTLSAVSNNPAHVFVRGDIRDQALVSSLLHQYQPDALINFAAESHVDRSIDGPGAFVETNVLGTLSLLEASLEWWKKQAEDSRDAFRFLHISTDEVYGSLGSEGAFSETTAYAPNSPYAASKAASDHLVRAFYHTYGLPVLTSNCSNNYGPYQFPEKLIPLIILNALAGKDLPIYGDGQQIRDWLYVGDHCAALETILNNGLPGETYNIGGNAEKTNLEVVNNLCDLLDELRPSENGRSRNEQICFVADRPGHDRRYAIDASKLKNELGWSAQTGFKDGLRKTVEWYLANDAWITRVQDGSYRGERLGLSQDETPTEEISI